MVTHNVMNHVYMHVRANGQTMALKKLWSLLKRSIGGTYVSVVLFSMCSAASIEQAFRFNNRKVSHVSGS